MCFLQEISQNWFTLLCSPNKFVEKNKAYKYYVYVYI